MSIIEDYLEVKQEAKSKSRPEESSDETEIKRESLAILASLGTTKEYSGIDLNLSDISKLKTKEIKRYFNRYQSVLGVQLHKY